MTDDIVTQLRLLSASQKLHRFGDLLDDWPGEAADEIERLRTLLDNALERENKNNLRQLETVRKVEADRDRWMKAAKQ